jgi:hypothetical protein
MLIKDLKSEVTAKTLSLDKDTVDLMSGSTAIIIVTVEYYDGHTENVTTKARYQNSNSPVASISAGKITAKSKGTTTVTVSFKGSLGDTVKARLTINVTNRDPYNRNEAEDYNAQNGIQTENCSDTDGGINVGFIENGDWLRFNSLDFGSGAASFEARVASATNGGNLEIRLDSPTGTLAGTCAVSGTGGWQIWVTKSWSVSSLSGIHDIYLEFTGGSGYLFNINWWKYKPEQAEGVPEENSSSNETPHCFSLGQNYPNPFNPITEIRYDIPEISRVTLKVFDFLGRNIATLVNERKVPGSYEVNFDASTLSSGVYFYALRAGNRYAVRKMALIK